MGNLNTSQLIDAVDDRDRPIRVVNRKDLTQQRTNFRTAHVFVFDRHSRLLLQEIARGQRSERLLGSSVAGYVNAGEAYRKAAERKILAELGVAPRLMVIGKTAMPDLGGTEATVFKKTLFEELLGLNRPVPEFKNARATLAVATTEGMQGVAEIIAGKPRKAFWERIFRNRVVSYFIWLLMLLAVIDVAAVVYTGSRVARLVEEGASIERSDPAPTIWRERRSGVRWC